MIQMITTRVCQNRNVPVPMNRARFSDSRPKVSGSMSRLNRRPLLGWSSRRRVGASATARSGRSCRTRGGQLALLGRHRSQNRSAPADLAVPAGMAAHLGVVLAGAVVGQALFPPVVGQQVVEHVVDGDGTEQVLLVVDDRGADQVVGRRRNG